MEFGDSGDERLVVLNSVAKSIVGKQRGISKEWGFLTTVPKCIG